MNKINIVIAISNKEAAMQIRSVLLQNNYHVEEICFSGSEAIRKVRIFRPDILIVNYELKDTTGLEISQIITEDKLCTVLILTTQVQKEYIESFIDNHNIICVIKPVNKVVLINTIEIILKNRNKIKQLENEVCNLKEKLEVRKLVEKAKGVLMKKFELTEEQAYKRIQRISMDSRMSMKDVAKTIVKSKL